MISKKFKEHLSNIIKTDIENIQSVSGGDISLAFKISTKSNSYFLKVNSKTNALQMFQTEAKALKAILKTKTIKTPQILSVDTTDNLHYILMEFIDTKTPSKSDLNLFGQQLANLHKTTNQNFGLEFNNYIGSLNQSNKTHTNWNDFYIEERLVPQLHLAKQKGLLTNLDIPKTEHIKTICNPYFKNIKPSLLHGDLWSGNYLISKDGTPYLIDPASYFGHSEVDIAMSKLFGSFGQSFYKAYHCIIPQDSLTNNRIELYQLYYLLVHLNLFGSSYYASVKHILNRYF